MVWSLYVGTEPIALRRGQSFSWSLGYGPQPYTASLETTAASAERIWQRAQLQFPTGTRTRERSEGGPLSIRFEDGKRKVEVQGIYALELRPGSDFNTRVLTLADRRWLWSRTILERSYNLRRKTGDYRLVRGAMAPIQLGVRAPDYAYRRSTLNNGEPWTALEVLEDVLSELCGIDGFTIDPDVKLMSTVEGLELHDPGPDALNRVLALLPGAQVFIGYDGRAHVASIYDQSEIQIAQTVGAPNLGDWRVVDRSVLRPQAFHVYADREVELRFDHVEERGTQEAVTSTIPRSQAEDLDAGREDLWCENVILNPLYELPLDGAGNEVASYGEAVPVAKFLDAVNLMDWDPFQPSSETLTQRVIRANFLGAWQKLLLRYAFRADQQWDPQRLLVMNAIRTHWRQTYRLLPQWRDKIRELIPLRAAILDTENGVRAPASVFTQHITKFSQLGYGPFTNGQLAYEVDNYADDLSGAELSPFVLEVMDSDQGIFRVAPKLDQTGLAETYVLGKSSDSDLPSADTSVAKLFWHQVTLSPSFKLAVVLSATQDTPNGIERLHKETVSLSDAAEALGIEAPNATGPDQELLQTQDTVRCGWIDNQADQIREAFFSGADYPADLLVNRQTIRDIAVASAANVLAATLDRAEGNLTVPMQPISPTGNLRAVTHTLAVGPKSGAIGSTNLSMPGEAAGPSIWSLLPEGTRKILRRLVA